MEVRIHGLRTNYYGRMDSPISACWHLESWPLWAVRADLGYGSIPRGTLGGIFDAVAVKAVRNSPQVLGFYGFLRVNV